MSVEFLPSDDAPEHVPAPAAHVPGRRWWWLLGVALLVGALAYAVNRPGSPHPQPAPHAVAACRGVPDCAVRDRVPASIARLARAYLPPGAQLHVRSVVAVESITHEELLVARDITATTEWVTITIQVRRSGAAHRTPEPALPFDFKALSLQQVNSGFVVHLDYLAPTAYPPRTAALRAFIRDPRLATA